MDDIVETEILHSKLTDENDQEETNKELIELIEEVGQDESDEPEKIDCIYKVIGSFGPWHLKFVSYYTIVYFISAFHNIGIVFYAARKGPVISLTHDEKRSLSLSLLDQFRNNFWCADLSQNLTEPEQKILINKCVPNCKNYEYDRSLFHTTIVTEFGLICDRAWFVSACASIYQIGYAFSSIIVGYSSDTYGRKLTYKAMVIIEIFSGLGQALAPNVYVFLASRFVLGIAAYGRFLTGNLLIMETAGPKKRALLSIFVENGWYCGTGLLIASFYFISNFRYIQLMVTAFEICSLFYFNLTPESIRWLLTRARYDEARTMLYKAANMKKKKFSQKNLDNRIDSLIEHFKLKKLESTSKPKDKGFLLFKLWRLPGMFKLCVCFYILWFSNSLISYSTTFNSTDFGDNIYVNIGVFGIASFTANLILTFIVERFRRLRIAKISFFFMFISIFAITINFYQEAHQTTILLPALTQGRTTNKIGRIDQIDQIHNNYTQLKQNARKLNVDITLILNEATLKKKVKSQNNFRLWNGIILKYCSSFAFHMVFILCVECFPTIIRQFSIGTCSVASRFASVVAPFTKELSTKFGVTFTFSIFSTLTLLSFCLCFCIPETKNREIPNTLEDCLKMKQDEKEKKFLKKTNNC